MTKIKGKPNWPGALKIVIREDRPYRTSALGISPGLYEGTWDETAQAWTPDIIMPRYDQPDAIGRSEVHVFISREDGRVVAKYDYAPHEWVETAPGELDLGKAKAVRRWVATEEFAALTEQVETATDGARDAAAEARKAAVQASQEAKQLGELRDQVDGALADAAQLRAALDQYTQLNSMATLATLAQQGADALYAREGWSAMPTMNGSALELRSAPSGLIQFIPLDDDTIEISSPSGAYAIYEQNGEIFARRNA